MASRRLAVMGNPKGRQASSVINSDREVFREVNDESFFDAVANRLASVIEVTHPLFDEGVQFRNVSLQIFGGERRKLLQELI
ncbi:hypothetical protein AWB80_03109 [Caballeronia pedi]|uniref:Uncharacterized protein n=1 Tax=Caballeronia pedi TaxID=1777141 RepID=A0A158B7U8_9BURK|nr:hypothetical protein AWB80_03109 [Caballeronia pedi]